MSKRSIDEVYPFIFRFSLSSTKRLNLDAVDDAEDKHEDTIRFCELKHVSLKLGSACILSEIIESKNSKMFMNKIQNEAASLLDTPETAKKIASGEIPPWSDWQ